MKKQHVVALLLMLCVLSLALSMSQAQTSRAFSTRSALHNETGALRFVGANPGQPIVVPAAAAPGLTDSDRTAAVLDVYGPQFGVANPRQDLRLSKAVLSNGSRIVNRYQQYYQGIPVIGGQINVTTTSGGGLLSINGEASPNLTVSTTATFDSASAQLAAINWAARRFGVNASELVATKSELSIYDSRLMGPLKHPVQLVWNVEVTSTGVKPIRAMVLVNAHKGSVALGFNQLDDQHHTHTSGVVAPDTLPLPETLPLPGAEGDAAANDAALAVVPSVGSRVPGTADLATYDLNGGNVRPGTFLCDETQQPCTNGANEDADSAHLYAKHSYDYFWNNFGRDSLDDEGLLLISSVRYSPNGNGAQYCNANWNGTQMTYGKDCDLVVDDVVGHELTHGLTDYTSGLYYFYQSGAINESISDVFGEFIDLGNGSGDDSAGVRWVLGEETPFSSPSSKPGLRFMDNPPEDGVSPDRIQSPMYWMEEYVSEDWDNGGVHINSGINNKAAYLMVDGDTFNGITVTGLGIEKVAAIYYDVQTTKMVSGTDYNDLYELLYQSCLDLVGGAEGITLADCDQVTNATQAVEMHLLPVDMWSVPEAEVCPVGQTPSVVFGDDFEDSYDNFVTGALTGADSWMTAQELNAAYGITYTHSGVGGWVGENLGTGNDNYLAMVNGVNIPAGAYLRFDHAFLLDYWEVLYDGGIVEYTTDGTTWTQLDTIDSGHPYVDEIASGTDSPIAGQPAFGYDSHGYVSTRFNLNGLAGQNVKFRWRLAEDEELGFYGWFIDDIFVYTCSGEPQETETPGGPTETPGGPTETPQATATQDPNVTELVVNGGFENGTTGWDVKNSTGDKAKCNKLNRPGKPDKIFSNSGECAFRFKGGAGEASSIKQNLNVNLVPMFADDTLDIFFAMDVPNSSFGKIKVIVKYSDGTDKGKITGSTPQTDGYEGFGNPLLLASSNIDKIKVSASNRSTSGKWYLDDVSIWHVPAGAGLLGLPGSEGKLEFAPRSSR